MLVDGQHIPVEGRGRGWQIPNRRRLHLGWYLEYCRQYRHPWHFASLGFEGTPWHHNDVMFDWATIVGQLLTTGDSNYKIGTMYLEFKNVASPGDTVSPPTILRSAGISYYASLSGSPNTDYLRVPVIAAQLTSSNETDFPGGNIQNYFAISDGVTGVNGVPFSDADNSLVYGGALVASPDFADASQDLVLSRFYFPTDQQQPKLATGQVGLQRQFQLG